jgi:hypothetical protein
MKVNFQRFEVAQQALGLAPLYPIAKWSAKDDPTFNMAKDT